jgi:hypothetical protein
MHDPTNTHKHTLQQCATPRSGKKGVDMAGMTDLGGVKFFNLSVETPEGDLALLDAVLEGG